jgi:hypothetical protein
MLSLVGTLLGLLGSLFPEILKLLTAKEDHKHEIEMGKLQMDAMRLQGQIKLEELSARADIEEAKAVYAQAEQKITGVRWIDGFVSLYQSSVRPTLTYGFFCLYAYVKYSMIYSAVKAGYNWQMVGQMIWNSEDFAVFSTIVSFYFGGRFLKYSLQRAGLSSNGKGNGR